jgi:prepilin-type N-terminal cleavage/methylation domain-containing protein
MNKKGFTLIEAVVAMALAAIAIVTLFKLNLQTIATTEKTKFYATAPMLAKIKLADVKMQPLDYEADSSGNFDEDFPGYQWDVMTSEVASEIINRMAENSESDMGLENSADLLKTLEHFKRVDIEISGFNSLSYKLRTYLFLYEKTNQKHK